jgi:hypothetical protein
VALSPSSPCFNPPLTWSPAYPEQRQFIMMPWSEGANHSLSEK